MGARKHRLAEKKAQATFGAFGQSDGEAREADRKRAEAKAQPEGAVRHEVISKGRRWHRVDAARSWRPETPGEELVGRYVGRQDRHGIYGPYTVILIREEDDSVRYVSGGGLATTMLAVDEGVLVRIVFEGTKPWTTNPENTYRVFEVWTV